MAETTFKRKMSTILCGDVVGYSCLTGEDDVATLHALKTCAAEFICFLELRFPLIAQVDSIAEIERRLL